MTKGKDLFAVEAFLVLMFCMGGMGTGMLPPEDQTATTSTGSTGTLPPKAQTAIASTGSTGTLPPEDQTAITSTGRTSGKRPGGALAVSGLTWFMLNVGFYAYGVWFTFKGMDGMQHTPCNTYAFFCARVNLFNWYRVWLISNCLGALRAMTSVAMAINGYILDKEYMGEGERYLQYFFILVYVFFAIGIELSIKWNHISGVNQVNSTGQLLPLVVGTAGSLKVLLKLVVNLVKEYWLGERKGWFLF